MLRKLWKAIFLHPLKTVGFLLLASFLVMSLLDSFGVIAIQTSSSNEREIERQERHAVRQLSDEIQPLRIVINKVGVDSQIQNPNTTDTAVLDSELRYGAVHYPGSGTPGNGNMFLFGHSTNLSVVQNQAYKTFNGTQKLEKGDEVFIYSENQKHVYKVLDVRLVSAEETLVDFSVQKDMLTLSTCNNFGEKQERFVVEADYVRSEAI